MEASPNNRQLPVNIRRKAYGKLQVLYTNADGIAGKHDQLREIAHSLGSDIIAISETKLKENINNATVFPSGFNIIRRDRTGRGGGGIALLVNNSLGVEEVSIRVESGFQEHLTVKVVTEEINILVALIYNPPRGNGKSELYNINNQGTIEVVNRVSQIAVNKGYRLLILGDFNHKDIDWQELNPHGDRGTWRAKFMNCIQGNYLHQHIREPTRSRGNDTPSTLDLIFTQSALDIENLEYRAPLGKSDHCVLSMDFVVEDILPKKVVKKNETRFNYPKGDYQGLKEFYSNVEWNIPSDSTTTLEVNEVYNHSYRS